MSRGAKRKRASRPWQHVEARRELGDLLALSLDDALDLEGYEVQRVGEGRTAKDHLCPECGDVVPAGQAHVAVWPVDDSDLRRHWHRDCWRLEVLRSQGEDVRP
jgi:hypothetical protein